MTTIENVTAGQIRRVADAAGEAGDPEQVALCERALTINRAIVEVLSDDEEAISACVKAINAAEAMDARRADDLKSDWTWPRGAELL